MKKLNLLFFIFFIFSQLNAQTLTGRGATVPFTKYEAEDAATNASKLGYGTNYQTQQSEASGRNAVKLQSTGQYVEFTLTKAAKGLVFRYNMPDASGGGGINATLALYIDGTKVKDLNLTSKYAWVYGGYPYNNSPGNGSPHRFYDDIAVLLDREYPANTKIKLQKDNTNSASYYIIDFLEAESVPAAKTQPSNSVSITEHGGSTSNSDNTTALRNAINAAGNSGKSVWIPAGEFKFSSTGNIDITKSVTISGAGMWHTTLSGSGPRFMVKANNVEFHDFKIQGNTDVRVDDSGHSPIESDYHTYNMSGMKIKNIWIEHTKTGFWLHNMSNATISGCRVRNTFADGMNLCKGTSNSVVEHTHVRNTGDDGIALWSLEIVNKDNKIRFNTVEIPSHANGIAVYGGQNTEITDNIVSETIFAGGGISVSMWHSPKTASGTVTVARNTLLRCGSKGDYDLERGAIWINASEPFLQSIVISNNDIYNSTYQGLSISEDKGNLSVSFKNNKVYNSGTYGVYVPREAPAGTVSIQNNVFCNNKSGNVEKNWEARTTVVESGTTGCGTEPEPGEPENVTVRFKAPTTWTNVHAYVWGTSEVAGGWPGKALSKDAEGFYVFTFDKSGMLSANVIFNNNSTEKAEDIDGLSAGCWQAGSITGQDDDGVSIYAVASTDCSGGSEPEPGNPNDITVRFKAPASWTGVSAYVWGTSEVAGGWPGKTLSKDANGFYVFTFDKTGLSDVNVIFNNKGAGEKAADINGLSGGCWQAGSITGQDEHGVNIYAVSSTDCGSGGTDPGDENVTVRFKAPASWTGVSAYVWGTSEVAGSWPGKTLSKDVNGFYVFTFDKTGIASANVIFNNNGGGEKAADIDGLSGGCWQAGNITGQDDDGVSIYAVTSTDCGTTTIIAMPEQNITWKFYPNPTKDVIYITPADVCAKVEVYSMLGVLLQTTTQFNGMIDLTSYAGGMYHIVVITENGKRESKTVIKQ